MSEKRAIRHRPGRRHRRRRAKPKPPGQAPGTPTYVGGHPEVATQIQVFSYSTRHFETATAQDVAHCQQFQRPGQPLWLQVTGLRDTPRIASLGQAFGMHALVIEDALNGNGRSKLDQDEDWLFVTLRLLRLDPADGHVEDQHLAFYVAPNLVITFCETATDVFAPVEQRLREGTGRLRSLPIDYLLWALLDAVIDHYFVVIDALEAHLEQIDEGLEDGADLIEIYDLHHARADVIALSRRLRPMREIVSQLSHSDHRLLSDATRIYFRDLYDHAIHAIDQTDDLRELSNSVRDFFLASVNNRMNEIMKVLACVSAVFLPLTFLAGVYGMNFDVLPEKSWRYGYLLFWLACILIVAGMLWFFRRMRWL
ncbi:MAG: magnesium/cobalt transporter CorA [Verrucomicrobiales bacterium]